MNSPALAALHHLGSFETQVPRLQPMLITSESLGWNPGVSIFKACVVQPKLRNSAFQVQSDLGF